MGTRHLIAVVVDGEYKIAQYGQWDGYPSGQGAAVLGFLQTRDMDSFRAQCQRLRWITNDEIEVVDKTKNWPNVYPHLSRDAGAKVLGMVYDMIEPLKLQNNIEFAQDGLLCEWAYVIDLDREALEVYEGFKDTPALGRFAGPVGENGYGPVQLNHEFSFDELRELDEIDFIKLLDPPDSDDDNPEI